MEETSTTNPIWAERFRPRRVEDVILPSRLKDQFRGMVESGKLPNLILSGPPGVGKTTVALAMLHEMGHDVYVVNGSLKGNIDTLRNEIMDFVSSVSFTGARKTVLIDEADYLTHQTQPALRNFMEEFSGNAGFVLTCNFPQRLIEPLHSRCTTIDFSFSPDEKLEMAGEFFKSVKRILDRVEVEYDVQVLGAVIKRYYPDWRRCLNELQGYASSGKIDSGALSRDRDSDLDELVRYMRDKDFTKVRKWVAENSSSDSTTFFRRFYDHAKEIVTDDSIPQLVLTIGEYQYKTALVADQEVNMAAFLVHVMASCQIREK